LFVATFASEQYFEYLSQMLNATDQGPWPAQLGGLCFGLVEDCALLLLFSYFIVNLKEKMSWDEFFRRYLAPLTAESLRALTSILLWSLALIVPGLVMYCRLIYFAPFVVLADPTYKTRPDAVARAKELTRGCWGKLSLFMLGLTVVDALFVYGPSLLNIESLFIVIFENLVQESGAKGVA
jgi:hypothetical protein